MTLTKERDQTLRDPDLALFDPDNEMTFTGSQSFAVAAYSVWENISSVSDLLNKLHIIRDVVNYSAAGAIRSAVRDNQKIFKSLDPGDFFIVYNQDTGALMRFTVEKGSPLTSTASAAWDLKVMIDPFGEVLRSYRSLIYCESNIEPSWGIEDDDCDLEHFSVAWEAFEDKAAEAAAEEEADDSTSDGDTSVTQPD